MKKALPLKSCTQFVADTIDYYKSRINLVRGTKSGRELMDFFEKCKYAYNGEELQRPVSA